MPPFQTLCLPPTYSPVPNNIAAQFTGLSTKTTSSSQALHQPNLPLSDHHLLDLPLPLPDLPAHVREKILSIEIMGIDYGRALALNPALRDASPDSIDAVITYLLSKGLRHTDLPRILGMCPGILTSRIRSDLSPVFAFLSRDLRVPAAGFRRVINKCPRLLISSVRGQLIPTLSYLQRLGFRDAVALAYQDPVLLVSSVEQTLMPKLEFLMGLGLSREDATGMALRCPTLLTFSIEKNFKPKYKYLTAQMRGTTEEIKEFPQYFAFSLEKRIKPRHREMAKRGVWLSLPVMLKSTDVEFDDLIQYRKKESEELC